jgi:hypothetical protein
VPVLLRMFASFLVMVYVMLTQAEVIIFLRIWISCG